MVSIMNPAIKLSILAVTWTILASTSQAPPTPSPVTNGVEIAARQLLDNLPPSNSQFHPISQLPLLQTGPPLCVYPPPSAALPLPVPSPPSPGWPPPGSGSSHPPPYAGPEHHVWCVAKSTVPASAMQPALDYACASGADCEPIRLNGLCYQPDTVLAHASYAFNSYWQRTKRAGGTCEFGGSAMLVTVDPSYDECRFIYA